MLIAGVFSSTPLLLNHSRVVEDTPPSVDKFPAAGLEGKTKGDQRGFEP